MPEIKVGKDCETCGNPAVCIVRDTVEYKNIETGWTEMDYDGDPHFFCDEHKRDSITRKGNPRKVDWTGHY